MLANIDNKRWHLFKRFVPTLYEYFFAARGN